MQHHEINVHRDSVRPRVLTVARRRDLRFDITPESDQEKQRESCRPSHATLSACRRPRHRDLSLFRPAQAEAQKLAALAGERAKLFPIVRLNSRRNPNLTPCGRSRSPRDTLFLSGILLKPDPSAHPFPTIIT